MTATVGIIMGSDSDMPVMEKARAVLDKLGHPDLSAGEIEGIRRAIRESGAVAETVGLIDSLAAKAVAALDDAPIAPEVASALRSLADLVALRNA